MHPSRHITAAATQISRLPGIGKKTALRLALHLMQAPMEESIELSKSILTMRDQVRSCVHCHNLSDDEVCAICSGLKRDRSILCIVATTTDVQAIEEASVYRGLYHVLGGVISPINGIGVDKLNIAHLIKRATEDRFTEIIIALPSTMEGDTTTFYLKRVLEPLTDKVSTLSKGVAVGADLEYVDEITLGRSFAMRIAC
jgi:recombination protein RecR